MGQDPSLLSHKTGAPQVGPVGVRQRQLSCFPEQLRHNDYDYDREFFEVSMTNLTNFN